MKDNSYKGPNLLNKKRSLWNCRKEIQYLFNNKLIEKSTLLRVPQLYVNKNAEIERGIPRVVINDKSLNKALRQIKVHIPNRKEFLERLHSVAITSNFDMKYGYSRIQIVEIGMY